MIHKTAIIYDNVEIGNNVTIYPYAVIGSPAEYIFDTPKFDGKIIIEDNVTIRDFTTISAPIKRNMIIGSGTHLMSKSYIGHDSLIGRDVVVCAGAKIGGHANIGNYVYFGFNATCHQFSKIDDYCMIGANGFFKGTSPKGIIWAGVPARPLKVNTIGLERNIDDIDRRNLIDSSARKFINK